MKTEEFEQIIKPLFLIDNKGHSDFLKESFMGNFNKWKISSDLTNAKLVEENERLKELRTLDLTLNVQLQNELSAAKERVKELEEGVLRTNEAWPLVDILKQLVKATDILLKDKGWDGNTWEEMQVSSEYAKKIIIKLLTPKQHG